MFSRILWRKSPRCPETRLASHDDERAVVDQPLPGRAGTLFKRHAIVSRLPDNRLRSHTRGQCYRRTRQRAAARPALCGNLHVHLEVCSGIPAAGGVMHPLTLRLSAEVPGWIAGDGQDRFLIVDDILLPLVRLVAPLNAFEKVLVVRFPGAALGEGAAGLVDTRQLQVAMPQALPGDRRDPAQTDRQVLDAAAAGDVSQNRVVPTQGGQAAYNS